MPQLILEVGEARSIVFKWLDNHPYANYKELRNQFSLKRKTLVDYHYQWKLLHKEDQLKKDLIFILHLMERKTQPKGQITFDEREMIYNLQLKVHTFERELGIIKKSDKIMMGPYEANTNTEEEKE